MKKLPIHTLLLSFLALGACSDSDGPETPETPQESSTIDLSYMDTTVSPRDDFFKFANGNWVKENPVPSDESSWGSFNELRNRNNDILKQILESAAEADAEKGSTQQLIGDYFAAYMDIEGRDAAGTSPIKEHLDKIANAATKEDLVAVIADQHDFAINSFFNMGVDQDLGDNTQYIIYIGQGGIAMPTRDFYTEPGKEEIRQKYLEHVSKIFALSGIEMEAAKEKASTVLAIETRLAESSMGPTEMRNIEAMYNRMTFDEAKDKSPNFGWDNYLAARGIDTPESVVVTQPKFFMRFNDVLNTTSLEDLKTYLTWSLLDQMAGALTSDFDKQNFWFYSSVLRGVEEMKAPWERGLNHMQFSALGEAVGHAFVDETFSPESKAKVNEMVDNLTIAFEDRLDQLDWMSDSTKMMAREKLAAFGRKLGYPDKWTDYASLEISRESHAKNFLAGRAFDVKDNLSRIGDEIRKEEWGMPPHMINAYYDPLQNEIAFPAGILQPPFFDPNAEDAVNYGRMGMVIGHELTHGFDDQGAQFDKVGVFRNWWSAQDKEEFDKRTALLEAQFNEYIMLDTMHVNGKLTLGENIADLGGLTLAYYAYQNSLGEGGGKDREGYTWQQRYFIGFAQIWKINYKDEALQQQIETNTHAPGMLRVNGPLANMPEFFEAFGVQEGDSMRRPADKIAKIW